MTMEQNNHFWSSISYQNGEFLSSHVSFRSGLVVTNFSLTGWISTEAAAVTAYLQEEGFGSLKVAAISGVLFFFPNVKMQVKQ